MIDEKTEPNVWRTAVFAIAIFVGCMFVAGMFGDVEAVAIVSQKMPELIFKKSQL